jgi:hypothetical protein
MSKHSLILVAILALTAHAGTLTYNNFQDLAGLALSGAAAQSGSTITLNPDLPWTHGSVFIDSPFNPNAGFSISSTFSMASNGSPGDGLVFRLQPNPYVPSVLGGALTIYQVTGLFIVIDTYANAPYSDPPAPSLSVIGCGVGLGADPNHASGCFLASAPITSNLFDGNGHSINIAYDLSMLSVSIDNSLLVQRPTNLGSYLSGPTFFGASGVTGGLSQANTLLSASLVTTESPEPSTIALVGLALCGCFFVKKRRVDS